MRRLLVVALACIALASCRSYPRVDPIYGRQTVPAQRTGAIGALSSQPPPPPGYYDRPGAGGSAPPPPGQGGNDNLTPPGGFDFRPGSSPTAPSNSGASTGGDSRWSPPGRSVSSGNDRPSGSFGAPAPPLQSTSPDDPYGGPSRYENRSSPGSSRYEAPSPSSSSVPRTGGFSSDGSTASGSNSPYRAAGWNDGRGNTGSEYVTRSTSGVQDIMDLPPKGSPGGGGFSGVQNTQNAGLAAETSSRTNTSSAGGGGFAAGAAASDSPDRRQFFDFDPEYRWLKGRLEYSNISRRWKLRYIPVSGDTDRFGGSVILQDAPQLADFLPGDFVMVEGQVSRADSSGGFSPLYRIDRISRMQ